MKTGRNDPCPCGSGKKAKRCCGGRPGQPLVDWTSIRLPVAAGGKQRACDGCTACCLPALVINEPELVKPKDRVCPHVCAEGCSVWGSGLPSVCRDFNCSYLVEAGHIPVEARPDQVGAIVRRGVDRVATLTECRPDGLHRLFANPTWRPILHSDLADGWTFKLAFHDDPYDALVMHVRRSPNGLGVELAGCDEDGEPILAVIPGQDGSELRAALFLKGQSFAFDAHSLIYYLGDRDMAVLASSKQGAPAVPIRFHIRRRQADALRLILELAGVPVGRPSEPACTR